MRIVITGAAGKIGRLITENLSDAHELVLLDRRAVEDRASIAANLSRRPGRLPLRRRWDRAFEGADAVIHLAAISSSRATWRQVLRNNIQATWNVLETAADHGVGRVVFASSPWAVRAAEESLGPGCFTVDGPKMDSDVPPRPRTPYGLSKALGEIAGRMYVDEGRLETFVVVRIGFFNPGRSPADERIWHHRVGSRDLAALIRRCVETDLTGFHVVYGVSAQPDSPFDLSYTRRLLGWDPVETPPPA